MPDKLVLLEFTDEADAYLDQCRRQGLDPSDAQVVSLDPRVEAHLAAQGVQCVNTLGYFDANSHARALRKSHGLLEWLAPRFQVKDGLGLDKTYSQALLWYSRYFIHHMLWLAEVLSRSGEKHPNATILAALGETDGQGSPMVQPGERYLGHLARQLCLQRGFPFQTIDMPSAPAAKTPDGPGRGWLRRLGIKAGARLHRAALRRMSRHRPLLAVSHGNRMDALVGNARREAPDLDWVVRGEISSPMSRVEMLRRGWQAITAGAARGNGHQYIGEVWYQALAQDRRADPAFVEDLKRALDHLAAEIQSHADLFAHQDIGFADYYASKVSTGIRTALVRMHSEISSQRPISE